MSNKVFLIMPRKSQNDFVFVSRIGNKGRDDSLFYNGIRPSG